MSDEEREPTDDEIVNEAFNNLRESTECLLALVLGLDIADIDVGDWVIVAAPTIRLMKDGDKIPVQLEPRIITERHLQPWKAKGLLVDATDSYRRDDLTESVVEVFTGGDEA